MERRRLTEGLEVSALGLGCMGMSEFYGPRDDARAMRVLARAVELGVDLLDTADTYGHGHNEELVGRFLRETDARVRVATKFGIVRRPGSYERRIDNSPTYAREACEASLRRLGVERVDVLYVHRIEPGRPIEEVMGVLADLVAEGLVAHVGLCEPSAETLRRAHAVHPVAAVQSEWSLWTRDLEVEVLPAAREIGAALVPYSPLGRGFLTGAFDAGALTTGDTRAGLPRFQGEALAANASIVERVREVARRYGATPAQTALAWLLAKGPDVVPIPGTTRPERVEENAGAAGLALTPEDVALLDRVATDAPVVGARYTAEGMKGVGA